MTNYRTRTTRDETVAQCPDCWAGDLTYRVTDEDTGLSYPLDDGEHYCRHCETVWTDDDVLTTVTVTELADGWNRAAA
jgi:hypothetical protein